MFGLSQKEKYQHYLDWFEENVKDPNNWSWMRKNKDCANYACPNRCGSANCQHLGKPMPYEMGEAMFLMSDPKKMAKALSRKIENNHQKYTEMGKYINGDPKQGTFNEEYADNYKTLKAYQEKMKTFSGDAAFASDEAFRLAKEAEAQGVKPQELMKKEMQKMDGHHVVDSRPKEPQKPDGVWIELNVWEAFKHWMAGGKVEDSKPPTTGMSVNDMIKGKK